MCFLMFANTDFCYCSSSESKMILSSSSHEAPEGDASQSANFGSKFEALRKSKIRVDCFQDQIVGLQKFLQGWMGINSPQQVQTSHISLDKIMAQLEDSKQSLQLELNTCNLLELDIAKSPSENDYIEFLTEYEAGLRLHQGVETPDFLEWVESRSPLHEMAETRGAFTPIKEMIALEFQNKDGK